MEINLANNHQWFTECRGTIYTPKAMPWTIDDQDQQAFLIYFMLCKM